MLFQHLRRSKGDRLASISGRDAPLTANSKTNLTLMRVPRMRGLPRRTSELETILLNIIRCLIRHFAYGLGTASGLGTPSPYGAPPRERRGTARRALRLVCERFIMEPAGWRQHDGEAVRFDNFCNRCRRTFLMFSARRWPALQVHHRQRGPDDRRTLPLYCIGRLQLDLPHYLTLTYGTPISTLDCQGLSFWALRAGGRIWAARSRGPSGVQPASA